MGDIKQKTMDLIVRFLLVGEVYQALRIISDMQLPKSYLSIILLPLREFSRLGGKMFHLFLSLSIFCDNCNRRCSLSVNRVKDELYHLNMA